MCYLDSFDLRREHLKGLTTISVREGIQDGHHAHTCVTRWWAGVHRYSCTHAHTHTHTHTHTRTRTHAHARTHAHTSMHCLGFYCLLPNVTLSLSAGIEILLLILFGYVVAWGKVLKSDAFLPQVTSIHPLILSPCVLLAHLLLPFESAWFSEMCPNLFMWSSFLVLRWHAIVIPPGVSFAAFRRATLRINMHFDLSHFCAVSCPSLHSI